VGGIDNLLAGLSDGATLPVVLVIAVLLGLRHATDPDHLAVVTGFVAGSSRANARAAARLGLAWGLGHAVTLVGLGLPLILFGRSLPQWAERSAETLIGLVIIGLAIRLMVRWRRGAFHAHEHSHGDDVRHAHLHGHRAGRSHLHTHAPRSPLAAFSVGLVHGAGGSAGVGILLVASIDSQAVAAVALAVLALATTATMAVLSSCFGLALPRWRHLLPAPLAFAGLAFGLWYVVAAVAVGPLT
jgi:ABC-type nickel/cobalt efflux system permease component RcnA